MSTATQASESNRTRVSQSTLALAAAILLGLAATLTAWSAYRESITGDQILKNYSEQQATIALANDTFGRADQQESLEISLFLEWAVTTATGSDDAANYLEQVMSDELYAAVLWWAEEPEENSPATPFVEENPYFAELPSQVLIAEGEQLLSDADELRLAAEEADALSDRFALSSVFFAVVLFIAGLTTIVQRRSIQVGFLVISVLGLAAGVVVLVTTAGWASLN
jgi:hypothetical protein